MNAYGLNRPCHPSVYEVLQAEKVFKDYIQEHAYETEYPRESAMYSSPELIVRCALSAVWEAGRLYQLEKGGV